MQNENVTEFMVIVSPTADNPLPEGLGRQSFRTVPRTGEYVEIGNEAGLAHLYRVKAVIHPIEPTSTSGDLLLEHLGPTGEILKKLHA